MSDTWNAISGDGVYNSNQQPPNLDFTKANQPLNAATSYQQGVLSGYQPSASMLAGQAAQNQMNAANLAAASSTRGGLAGGTAMKNAMGANAMGNAQIAGQTAAGTAAEKATAAGGLQNATGIMTQQTEAPAQMALANRSQNLQSAGASQGGTIGAVGAAATVAAVAAISDARAKTDVKHEGLSHEEREGLFKRIPTNEMHGYGSPNGPNMSEAERTNRFGPISNDPGEGDRDYSRSAQSFDDMVQNFHPDNYNKYQPHEDAGGYLLRTEMPDDQYNWAMGKYYNDPRLTQDTQTGYYGSRDTEAYRALENQNVSNLSGYSADHTPIYGQDPYVNSADPWGSANDMLAQKDAETPSSVGGIQSTIKPWSPPSDNDIPGNRTTAANQPSGANKTGMGLLNAGMGLMGQGQKTTQSAMGGNDDYEQYLTMPLGQITSDEGAKTGLRVAPGNGSNNTGSMTYVPSGIEMKEGIASQITSPIEAKKEVKPAYYESGDPSLSGEGSPTGYSDYPAGTTDPQTADLIQNLLESSSRPYGMRGHVLSVQDSKGRYRPFLEATDPSDPYHRDLNLPLYDTIIQKNQSDAEASQGAGNDVYESGGAGFATDDKMPSSGTEQTRTIQKVVRDKNGMAMMKNGKVVTEPVKETAVSDPDVNSHRHWVPQTSDVTITSDEAAKTEATRQGYYQAIRDVTGNQGMLKQLASDTPPATIGEPGNQWRRSQSGAYEPAETDAPIPPSPPQFSQDSYNQGVKDVTGNPALMQQMTSGSPPSIVGEPGNRWQRTPEGTYVPLDESAPAAAPAPHKTAPTRPAVAPAPQPKPVDDRAIMTQRDPTQDLRLAANDILPPTGGPDQVVSDSNAKEDPANFGDSPMNIRRRAYSEAGPEQRNDGHVGTKFIVSDEDSKTGIKMADDKKKKVSETSDNKTNTGDAGGSAQKEAKRSDSTSGKREGNTQHTPSRDVKSAVKPAEKPTETNRTDAYGYKQPMHYTGHAWYDEYFKKDANVPQGDAGYQGKPGMDNRMGNPNVYEGEASHIASDDQLKMQMARQDAFSAGKVAGIQGLAQQAAMGSQPPYPAPAPMPRPGYSTPVGAQMPQIGQAGAGLAAARPSSPMDSAAMRFLMKKRMDRGEY